MSSAPLPSDAAARVRALEHELLASPQDIALHRALVEAKRAAGDELGARAHLIGADTLAAHAAGTLDDRAMGLCNVATGYFMKGETATAARWYRLALAINPQLAAACQNLAAIHSDAGETAQAQHYRAQAYAIQRVFIEDSGRAARRVLVLCVGQTAGNIPVETLLPPERVCRIKYVIDYAAKEEDAQLPPYDLVLNAIGEADVAAPLQARLAHFIEHCSQPLLNRPDAVARTHRHLLPALLAGLDGVAVAPCIRTTGAQTGRAALAPLLAAHGLAFPLLARPLASHGGAGLRRCATMDELEACLDDGAPHYLSAFRDYAGADGHYRKYRIIFIDRQPFAYHLAISTHWLVHYFSADMENQPWKLAEERRFLDDPERALGSAALAALRAVGQRLNLDYAGIDFTRLADGRILVFEANATMLVHRERANGPLAWKNASIDRIVDAFEDLQARRTARPSLTSC